MAALPRILLFICVSGAHLSAASPVLRLALVVQTGQNVSLSCNLTSSTDVTWYLLRSDQLLPLLTVSHSSIGEDMVDFHSADSGRINNVGSLENGSIGLEIVQVVEEDTGLYFCSWWIKGAVYFNRGIHLAVDGVDSESAKQPCWTLGICVLPSLLVLCVVIIVGSYLCSGKPAVCCCDSVRSNTSLKVTEDDSLHYSSLNIADKPRPSVRGEPGLVREEVTYSRVASCKKPNRSHDHR